jgi:hypothetical protein
MPLVTDSPVKPVRTPEHNAAEIIQGSLVVWGYIGNTHRGRGDNLSTEKAWTVGWIRRFCRINLIERILKSVVVGRRGVF